VNGVDLFCTEAGRGEPILGIHGTPSSSSLWADAARELAEHGRCIVYDRRGFGRSGPTPRPERLDLATHVADAAALLDALDARPATVIGRSTGGLIALALAREHPQAVRRLVLLEPAVFSVDDEARRWAARLRRRVVAASQVHPARAAEAVVVAALGPAAWSGLPAVARDAMNQAGPAVLAETRGSGLDLSLDFLAADPGWVADVRCPTLLVSAEDSPPVLRRVNDRLLELLPDARATLVPGGHLIHPAHPAVLELLHEGAAPRSGDRTVSP
jgi:pimeloyl-ACP methyl ester carboxylesterase